MIIHDRKQSPAHKAPLRVADEMHPLRGLCHDGDHSLSEPLHLFPQGSQALSPIEEIEHCHHSPGVCLIDVFQQVAEAVRAVEEPMHHDDRLVGRAVGAGLQAAAAAVKVTGVGPTPRGAAAPRAPACSRNSSF